MKQRVKAVLASVIRRPGKDFWLRCLDNCAQKYPADTGSKVCDYVGLPTSPTLIVRETFEREWVENLTPITFEGYEFSAPKDHHQVLEHSFGADYMTPIKTPDAETGHDCIMYWREDNA